MEQYKYWLSEVKWPNCDLCGKDLLLTREWSTNEITQILYTAEVLHQMFKDNIAAVCFNSGVAVSQFRDKSTRTRFSFSFAANLLGLTVRDLDEEQSQVSHGETVRETANMIAFLTEIFGIRDDMFLGEGHAYMKEVAAALDEGYEKGILNQRPGIINLQSDIDHPTQTLADLLHLKRYFGSLPNLKGKKMAVTWAYSPSYGKPLSVPQGLIELMPRFGMEVTLAHPKGYDLLPEVIEAAQMNASESGGSFTMVNSMEKAFTDADIVYPKSWAPYSVMEKRTALFRKNDRKGLAGCEKESLLLNAKYKNWECSEEKMALTVAGNALYMHCLPADISGVSCKEGEVTAGVFDKYRTLTYKQAGYKPFIIAAVILNNRFSDPAGVLETLRKRKTKRVCF
ncbi:MAG: knotted carbamoyltransferase YgeW [Candidatus Aminicenantes bacterium]|nr:knotted carbamoyltransferase YgeW [Candidatus Aminicenantes bacterium]